MGMATITCLCVPHIFHLCRIITALLFEGSDLFLEPEVHHYLDALLHILLRSSSLLDFNEKVPGLTSFYDL
jgi:hypothetical protein